MAQEPAAIAIGRATNVRETIARRTLLHIFRVILGAVYEIEAGEDAAVLGGGVEGIDAIEDVSLGLGGRAGSGLHLVGP